MSVTGEQLNILLDFLDENRDLARGRLRNVEGRCRSQRLWEEISQRLNSVGGYTKTVLQWMKVWTDRKYLAKKSAGALRLQQSGTGGGPSTAPQLLEWELKVMNIMGEGFGGPVSAARVPAFPIVSETFIDETSSSAGTPSLNTPQASAPTAELQAMNQSRPHTRRVGSASRFMRPVSRRTEREEPFRGRLLEIEMAKVAEIRQLRESIQDLTALIREHLQRT